MMSTILKHVGMLALCLFVPAAIVCSPVLVEELAFHLRPQKRVKTIEQAAENTLPPTYNSKVLNDN